MENVYATSIFKKFKRNYDNSLMKHQIRTVDLMSDENCLTICMPTGTGKSRIIYNDILDNLMLPTFDTFVVASHRLLLNVQHFNELFETFRPILSGVGFIFVGSYQIDLDEFVCNKESNNLLQTLGINYNDIISSATDTGRISRLVEDHKNNGRDVIIITTYHSLDKLRDLEIHSLYCDEAHFLASDKEISMFKNNFEQINAKRKFFFTATPKDLIDETTDAFLMNNENIFGKRHGLSFREALDESLIVKPYIHLIEPHNLKATKKYLSPQNYGKIILDGLAKHRTALEQYSKEPEKCRAKILVKCPGVDDMWKIKKYLDNDPENRVKVLCGASWTSKEFCYYNGKEGVNSKTSFLKILQNLPNEEEAIILHYDILSEGIDVPGITGVMFLSNTLPTKSKILQTIGRSTRLHPEDRKNLADGRLAKCDYKNYIKPYCAVMLPVLDNEMRFSTDEIARMIIELRDTYDFEANMRISLGEDLSRGPKANEMEGLNDLGTSKSLFSKIAEIDHTIEIFDAEYREELIESEIKRIYETKTKDHVEYISLVVKSLKTEN